ncbi:hypothetical protein CP8484711_2169A, partial [Chlamydia psittaci 84-8471/1]
MLAVKSLRNLRKLSISPLNYRVLIESAYLYLFTHAKSMKNFS